MSKLTKVISIDPTRQVVEEVELNVNNLQALYTHLDCQTIDVVCRQPNGDALTVDDEALLVEPQPPAFQFEGYTGRIHGKAIVSGCNKRGNSTAPRMTVEEVRQKVRFLGSVYTEPFMVFIALD
jgi:hypothetical protein